VTQSLQPGGVVGRYRILSPMGAGGMGEVYRARDETLQRDVAIKVLSAAAGPDALGAARLLREARAAAALNHPNICTIHEVGDDGGRAFIAMELIEGQPLHHVIPPGSGLSVDRVLAYGTQIAEAVSHAHERGVLHRDLKAANVVITTPGRAKVLDFGLAKRFTTEVDETTNTVSTLMEPGAVIGTLAYMAPEQLRGQPADARSDVWSLGVMLHEMASGERPFGGQTSFEVSSAILNAPPRSLPGHLPRNLQVVIARCLNKEPDGRYRHAGEALAALEAVKAGTAPLQLPRLNLPRPRWPHVAAMAAATLLLVSALAVAFNVGGFRDRFWNPGPLFDSIAVMPLQNISGDADQDYLAVGMQQALISELAQLPGFTRVIARASTLRFRNAEQAPGEIARALGVSALVTGTIRRVGDRVQVVAELTDAAAERHVWGETYDRGLEDVLSLQKDVVGAIARSVELRLRPADHQRLANVATIKPEVYEAYLRGMYELATRRDGGDPRKGLAYLQDAIDKNPGDPYAYVGLAMGYATLGHSPASPDDAWIRARAAAERALTLAPDLAEAHAAMGDVKLYYERDWAGAERAFQRANQLNPNLAMNRYHYAWYLVIADRLDEAIREHERARDLDPLTPLHTGWLADLYRQAGRFDDAIAAVNKSFEIDPDFAIGWNVLSHTYTDMGRHDEAIAAAERAVKSSPAWTFALGAAYVNAGRRDEARQILTKIQGRPRTAYNAWALAMLHGLLGDRDEFFALIDMEPQHAWVPWVRMDPGLQPLWSDSRFQRLMTRLKLPMPKAKGASGRSVARTSN